MFAEAGYEIYEHRELVELPELRSTGVKRAHGTSIGALKTKETRTDGAFYCSLDGIAGPNLRQWARVKGGWLLFFLCIVCFRKDLSRRFEIRKI